MERIIKPWEKEKLIIQQWLKDLYTGDYLNDIDNQNFKIISELFFNNNTDRTKLFNVGSGLFTSVTDIIANFVGNPMTDINIRIDDYIKDMVSVGKMVMGLKRVDNGTTQWQLVPYYIPAENHVISDNIHKVFTTYSQIENDKLKPVFYILVQEFTPWLITNKLYKKESVLNDAGSLVSLETLTETKHLKEKMATWLDYVSIFYKELTDLPWVQSELDRIKPLIYSLERKAVMFETQFLKDTEQYKIFDNIDLSPYVDSNWELNLTTMWKVFENKNGMQWDIKFVNNKNELIADAIEYEQTQLRKIGSFTSIPVDFLGITGVTSISWTSRALMMWAFIEKIQSYRDLVEELLTDILEKMIGTKNKEWKVITNNIVRGDILSKSDNELVEELKIALESWIISRYTGIQKYLKYKTEKEVMAEIKRIKKEADLFGNPNQDGWQDKDNADV